MIVVFVHVWQRDASTYDAGRRGLHPRYLMSHTVLCIKLDHIDLISDRRNHTMQEVCIGQD